MATTISAEVTTSRKRTASESNHSYSIWSSEGGSEEAFDPMDAVPAPSPARPPWEDLSSGDLKDHPSNCQDCRRLSEESGRPMQCPVSPSTRPSSRLSPSEMPHEVFGMNEGPTSDPTHSRPHASLTHSSFMGACPAPSPVRLRSDDIVSWNLEDCPLGCQACWDLSKESSHPMQCPGSPSTNHSPRPNPSEMANEAIDMNDEPTSDSTHSRYHASLLPSTKTARCFKYVNSIPSKVCHRWLGSLLGLSTLTLAMVSLLMFTVRSYRMAVWTTRNDELQACTGLIQAERPVGPNCERLILEGPQDPPYILSRRMIDSGGPGNSRNLSGMSVIGTDSFLPVEMNHSAWLVTALIFALISLADLLLNVLRHRTQIENDLENPTAIEIATLPHHDQRSEIMDDDHPDALFPGAHTDPSIGIRRRIRLGQEVQDEISIKDQSVGEDLPYSVARYLNQPPEHWRYREDAISLLK